MSLDELLWNPATVFAPRFDPLTPLGIVAVMAAAQARDVIHKVNNLLTVIFTQAEIVRATPDDLPQARRALQLIEQSGQETASIIRDFAAIVQRDEARQSGDDGGR